MLTIDKKTNKVYNLNNEMINNNNKYEILWKKKYNKIVKKRKINLEGKIMKYIKS